MKTKLISSKLALVDTWSLVYTVFLFLTSLLIASNSKAQNRRKDAVAIATISKYEFLVYNKTGYPLMFIYEGKPYNMKVKIESQFTTSTIFKGDPSFTKLVKIAEPILVTTSKKRLSRNDVYRIDYTNLNILESLKLIADKLGIDENTVRELLPKKDDERAELLMKFGKALLLDAGLRAELNNLNMRIAASGSYSEKLFYHARKKQFRAYNPLVLFELGEQRGYRLSDNWTRNQASLYKVSLSLFPEIVWSREKIKFSRLYFTGFYQANWHGLETDSSVYVGKNLLSGTTSAKEAVSETNTNKIALVNEIMGFGLKFNTQLNPIFYTYIEAGAMKKLSNYSLKIRDGYKFNNSSAVFSQMRYEEIIKTDKTTYPYLSLGLGATVLAKPLDARSTRRGLTLTLSGIAYNSGNLSAQSNYQIFNQSNLPLSLAHKKSGKIQYSWALNFGISI